MSITAGIILSRTEYEKLINAYAEQWREKEEEKVEGILFDHMLGMEVEMDVGRFNFHAANDENKYFFVYSLQNGAEGLKIESDDIDPNKPFYLLLPSEIHQRSQVAEATRAEAGKFLPDFDWEGHVIEVDITYVPETDIT